MERLPVILDTDIGTDIDDAVALAYLLKQPRCELVGVTTVSGEADRRAALADAVCRAAGMPGMPIHVGTADPFLIGQKQPHAQQVEALTEWRGREFPKDNTALSFMQKTIRERPGEITLLAVGPLTNLGLLFAMDPEIPSLLRQIVLMGGRYFSKASDGGVLEWNILCDPHAAARVFQARAPRLLAVGLDVTEKCRMDADECRRRFHAAGGPLAAVVAMAEIWFRHASAITFHDPLAAALIFEESICQMRSVHVEVDLINANTLGHTYHHAGGGELPHFAAQAVDPGQFFDHYFGVVGG